MRTKRLLIACACLALVTASFVVAITPNPTDARVRIRPGLIE